MNATKYTAENVKCQPIDKVKLDKDINELLHKQLNTESNITYSSHRKEAIIREPKLSIIDEEFIGVCLDENEKITFNIFTETRIDETRRSFGCFPEYEIKLTLNELADYLLPETTLAEFTKERRKYNNRIINNESEWMEVFNK
jgi:hypothetical protein